MTRVRPDLATSMGEVRAAVDSIDAEIVTLLAERMRFMDAAARIKPQREEVRDEARKAEVIARVKALAAGHGLAPELVETLWEQLVEASIAHELAEWDRLRRPARRHG
jgi:isochorismate pyruvate lyase